jgi:hypothetical protein
MLVDTVIDRLYSRRCAFMSATSSVRRSGRGLRGTARPGFLETAGLGGVEQLSRLSLQPGQLRVRLADKLWPGRCLPAVVNQLEEAGADGIAGK